MTFDVVQITKIDWQARQWQKKLVDCWCGHACPRLYPWQQALVAALFLEHDMPNGPLPDDRLDLICAATRREEPSREAFVTLALVDYVEDLELGARERAEYGSSDASAHLPYQLAWARQGATLSERTGLPGGIFKVRWPQVQGLV